MKSETDARNATDAAADWPTEGSALDDMWCEDPEEVKRQEEDQLAREEAEEMRYDWATAAHKCHARVKARMRQLVKSIPVGIRHPRRLMAANYAQKGGSRR